MNNKINGSDAELLENKRIGEKYYKLRHTSGLHIYLVPKKLTTAYALFGTRYGSVDSRFKLAGEADFTTVPDGIAHFLEHKLFEDENGEDAFKRYAKTGANANAYTGFSRTAYLFSCTDKFEESLEILLDFVTHPYFDEKTVAKEQGIIGQEIRMYEDNPDWRVYFGLLGALHETNPVRLDIAGTAESISKITPEILYRCYNTFYNLTNMALCVSGDVTPEQVLSVADRILSKPAPAIEIVRSYPDERAGAFKPRFNLKLQVSQPQFAIGVKDNELCSGQALQHKKAEIALINEYLFGGAGELFSELYSSGLIKGGLSPMFDCSTTYGQVVIGGESPDPEAVWAKVMAAMKKCAGAGIPADEFERCRRVCYAGMLMGFDSTANIANSFLDYIFEDSDIMEYTEILSSLRYEDVAARFTAMFREENCAMSVIEPLE